MRENLSTIFAVLIGVVVLIIFPLFSVMSRQDSISYNRVLTLTTEFVDGVRTTGYLTEKEYTNYLVNLSKTNNSYNIQMEYHQKILINDINNTSTEPTYVEDTLIYYNKDINRLLLENNGKIAFRENDEFYIKIYNTNITTASLLYNYFARVRVAPKVINIGYGGKVSHITGLEYTKTDFSNSYSPYIKLGEIVDLNGNNNKTCYDSGAGTYDIETCVRIFSIDEDDGQTIVIPFEMYNFENIIKYSDSTQTREIRKISSVQEFETNKNYIKDAIESLISLRGLEIEEQDKEYVVDITEIKFEKGVITGKIEISNIFLPNNISIKPTNVIITQGLGTGPTGIVSSEAKSHEIILAESQAYPQFELLGPFSVQEVSAMTTSSFGAQNTAYFKVILTDYESELEVKLRDLDTNEIVDESQYDISYVEEVTNKEYWIKINYYSLFDKNFVLEVTTDKPVEGQDDETVTEKATLQSESFIYESVDYSKLEQYVSASVSTTNGMSVINGYVYAVFNREYENQFVGSNSITSSYALFRRRPNETVKFAEQILNELDLNLAYYEQLSEGYSLNYDIEYGDFEYDGSNFWLYNIGLTTKQNMLVNERNSSAYSGYRYNVLKLNFRITMDLSSTTEQINRDNVKVNVLFDTILNEKKTSGPITISLRGLKIPQGFTHTREDNSWYITDNTLGLKFKWIPTTGISSGSTASDPYAYETYQAMRDSVAENKGYYLSTNTIHIFYSNGYSLATYADRQRNNIYYWKEAWEASLNLYKDHPDVVSHMPFNSQLTSDYRYAHPNVWTASYWNSSDYACKYYYTNSNGYGSDYVNYDFSQLNYCLALYLK